jgi:hypothetical protein
MKRGVFWRTNCQIATGCCRSATSFLPEHGAFTDVND